MKTPITFPLISSEDVSDEPLIVKAEVEGYLVRWVYLDEGSSVEVMFEHCFENLSPKIKARLKETQTDLVGFAREISKPLGKIELEVCFGSEGCWSRKTSMKFLVLRAPSPYNIILRKPGLKTLHVIPSTIHSMMKSPTPKGVATLVTRTVIIVECRHLERKQIMEEEKSKREIEVSITEEILVNPSFSKQLVTIGGGMSKACKDQLKHLLKDNMEVFAWEPSDMTRVPQRVIDHTLNVNPSVEPNLNSACPNDYYPLPNIDCKVESVMGFKYKCFLDAYKGYHLIQIATEDEEKTTFYTDQGTYCYIKMSFGLKNAGATYQRLIDSTFQSQIERNLEAYVDDMVIKSKDEKLLLVDISETFDNLRTINMKLNPKKCSFRVEEGKYLRYMVTSEWIRANPKKTKALADLQSPRKLASLNRFLAKSAERSLPFFNTLKNITKENKHEYRWTAEAEEAFQQMKKLIMDLPSLTLPFLKETLYAYLGVSKEAVSAVIESRVLFKKGYLIPMLRCVGHLQANYVIREIHMGSCGMHVGPRAVVRKAIRQGYYWPTMHEDAKGRFGLPRIIVTDNGAQLVNALFKSRCRRFEIQQMNTTVAYPLANGLIERANRSLMEGIKTRLEREKAGWVDELPNVLLAHRTSIKQSNIETPFSLTYGSKAVILVEIRMPTYRTLMTREEYNEEEQRLNLDLLKERREPTAIREARYKTKMEQYYNKRVRPTSFKPGEFVFRRNEASLVKDQDKLGPKWEGQYRVTEAYKNGSYKLQTLEDKSVPRTWHAINLRKCYM
ncbi:reverse transcriptase domain-containing protein [Tanacetum coccineum]